MQSTTSMMTKRQMIESQSMNGRCYLRLLATLPFYKTCGAREVEAAIIGMSQSLGVNPLGIDVLAELWMANNILRGLNSVQDSVCTEIPNAMSGAFTTSLMASGCRFSWEEIGGVYHIGSFLEHDRCTEVYCQHGWSARFILCTMVSEGRCVGADDSMSQFLGKWQSDEEDIVNDLTNHNEQLTERIRALQAEVSDQASNTHGYNEEKAEEAMSRLFVESQKSKMATESPIMPCDSSSQFDRYQKVFMGNGTVYDVQKPGKTVLSSIQEIPPLLKDHNVIKGYQRTTLMCKAEQRSLSKMHPINGLSNPFRSDRLNLLCHFHTAIDNLDMPSKEPTHYQAIKYLIEFVSKTPSEELAHQMIARTFCLKTNRIIANPFKLPFLEVGMQISDDSLAKCMDMIRSEYRMLWFENMKSLEVPTFHSDYKRNKEHKLGGYNNSSMISSNHQSKSKSKRSVSDKSASRSILGIR